MKILVSDMPYTYKNSEGNCGYMLTITNMVNIRHVEVMGMSVKFKFIFSGLRNFLFEIKLEYLSLPS
jgi:hypothetical protein